MHCWRKLIALVALLLLAAVPAGASHKDSSLKELLRWSGCTAELVTSDMVSVFNSGYDPGVIYIGTRPDVPEDVALVVAAHELGHCAQDRHGDFGHPYVQKDLELDADRYAANLLCAMGRRGDVLTHDTMVYLYEVEGYEGDDEHGTVAERIAAAFSAPNCRTLRAPQAP